MQSDDMNGIRADDVVFSGGQKTRKHDHDDYRGSSMLGIAVVVWDMFTIMQTHIILAFGVIMVFASSRGRPSFYGSS